MQYVFLVICLYSVGLIVFSILYVQTNVLLLAT